MTLSSSIRSNITQLIHKLERICSIVKERSPIVPGDPSRSWTHPFASAAELLHHFLLELSGYCVDKLVSFASQLIVALHGLGFDLNRQDARGRTLLFAYAHSIPVVKQLLQLGTDPSSRNPQGNSLLAVWAQFDRVDALLDVISQHATWSKLGVQIDVWERNSEGRTLLEVAARKGEDWPVLAMSLCELQRHWIQQGRPLHSKLLLAHTPLIRDVANIVLQFMDGLDQQGKPILEPVASAMEEE